MMAGKETRELQFQELERLELAVMVLTAKTAVLAYLNELQAATKLQTVEGTDVASIEN